MAHFPISAKARAAQAAGRCQAEVSADSWHFYQCRNKAVVERDVKIVGQPDAVRVRCCRTHDPEAAKARAQARPPSKYDRELAALYRRGDAADAMRKALVHIAGGSPTAYGDAVAVARDALEAVGNLAYEAVEETLRRHREDQ